MARINSKGKLGLNSHIIDFLLGQEPMCVWSVRTSARSKLILMLSKLPQSLELIPNLIVHRVMLAHSGLLVGKDICQLLR